MTAILIQRGTAMEQETQGEMGAERNFCPECGMEETGHFCRNCGTLLRGEDLVLCPRCHDIVPGGDFCNRCGQYLGGIALNLRQLALAGDDFWVTAATPASPAMPSGGADLGPVEPDASVVLADAELPNWLKELPVDSAPAEVQAHVYPSLTPIQERERGGSRRTILTLVLVLLVLLLLSLVVFVVVLLVRGG
jgi:hypothetical protein